MRRILEGGIEPGDIIPVADDADLRAFNALLENSLDAQHVVEAAILGAFERGRRRGEREGRAEKRAELDKLVSATAGHEKPAPVKQPAFRQRTIRKKSDGSWLIEDTTGGK